MPTAVDRSGRSALSEAPAATTEDRPIEAGPAGDALERCSRICANRTDRSSRTGSKQSMYTAAITNPPGRPTSRHVLDAHRELALVVGVADPAGALIDVGDLLAGSGWRAADSARSASLQSTRTRVAAVLGVDAHAAADHPVDVHADGRAAIAERAAHRVVRVDVGRALVGLFDGRDDPEVRLRAPAGGLGRPPAGPAGRRPSGSHPPAGRRRPPTNIRQPSRPKARRTRRPQGAHGRESSEGRSGRASATQAEALDQRAVARDVDLGDVLEQPATTTDQQQQPATRVVIVLVHLEVLGQIGDALGQHRDLGLRRTGVGVMQAVLAEDLFFLLGGERHETTPSIGPRMRMQPREARPPRTAARAGSAGSLAAAAGANRESSAARTRIVRARSVSRPSPSPGRRPSRTSPGRGCARRSRRRRAGRTGRPRCPGRTPRPCGCARRTSGWCRPTPPPDSAHRG